MSYAIIRNEKYTKDEMIQLAPHNERFKKKYSNKNIDLSKTSQNYHLKLPKENTYLKEYNRLIKENNLSQGQLHKNSIYVCEVILTSDNTFFNGIGKKETKRYFKECFKFMTEYNGIGKENILTAVVHLDEETPHMHLVYMPVVNAKDKKGNTIRKISASEFWKGKDSYKKLQNQFYKYITEKGVECSSAKYIDKPAILFVTRSGILRRIFPVCMVKIPFTVNQDLKVLVPSKMVCLEYLYWICIYKSNKILGTCMKSGTTVESISTDKLKKFKITVPTIEEQQEIVNILDKLLAKYNKIKNLEQQLEKIELLKKAILAKAFRGELGTNNPDEESAENLLKEILAEK